MADSKRYVRFFNEFGIHDLALVGGTIFCMTFFVGPANLRRERKLDALLKAQAQDPAQKA